MHSAVNGGFLIFKLNEPAIINCVNPQGASTWKWTYHDNQRVTDVAEFPGLTVLGRQLQIDNFTEHFHNQTFQCEGMDTNGNVVNVFRYHLIITSKL